MHTPKTNTARVSFIFVYVEQQEKGHRKIKTSSTWIHSGHTSIDNAGTKTSIADGNALAISVGDKRCALIILSI